MSPEHGSHPSIGSRCWTVAWCLLAVVHVTQSIWFSGLAAHPGDLGDARFNQLVLEHGYQSLQGSYDWRSPGMFHPVEGTLGLSDTHAGTLGVYALARWVGCETGRAFQVWYLALAGLNAWAMVRVLRALKADRWVAAPLVFLGCAPMTTVALIGNHAQLLPFFASLFAADQMIRYADDRRRRRLVTAAGWAAWQFAAAPYLAFFAGCLAVPLLWAIWPRHRGAVAISSKDTPIAPTWRFAVVTGFGTFFGLAAIHAHVTAISKGYPHPLAELFLFAPGIANWVLPPPGALFHRWTVPGLQPISGEALFFGTIPWLLAGTATIWAARNLHHQGAKRVIGCVAALALAIIMFTAPERSIGSLYANLASWVEPLRAFRSSARIIIFVPPILAAAAAVVLTAWIPAPPMKIRLRRIIAVGVAVTAAIETVTLRQPRVSIAESRDRTEGVVQSWRASGDRPVLAFAPGYSNQPGHVIHLDAWSAALALGRRTINGYSGSGPETHIGFGFLTTPDAATALINITGVDPADVSIVTAWEPEIARHLGIAQFASRPVAHLADWDLQPSAWNLFSPVETFLIEGRTMHQFTPPAEVRMPVPDGARHVAVAIGLRPGSYDGGGDSDGVSIEWLILDHTGTETVLWVEHVNPRDRPEHRGLREIDFNVPAGTNRTLILRTGHGPAGDGRWDWPVLGGLRVR